MNRITIEEITTKEFKIAARGYNQAEVDQFLDAICDEMELMGKEMDQLRREAEAAKAARPAASAPQQPAETPNAGGSIQEVLAMAVRLKDQTLAEARQQADQILSEAKQKAEAQNGSLMEEHDRLEKEVAALKAVAANYRRSFEQLLSEQQEALEKAAELF